MVGKLSKSMTVEDFKCGYWYAVEIKTFAKEIGITPVSGLRKDELEELIIDFLKKGKVRKPKRTVRTKPGRKDFEFGLKPTLRIVNYTNNPKTKEFLLNEAKRIKADFRPKSGAMYRLNRWREEQFAKGKKITYGDLAKKYVELCETKGSFPQEPAGRYINFLSDFLKHEENATHEMAREAWAELKRMPIRKNYKEWNRRR